MTFAPLADRVLVKRDIVQEKTAGGVFLAPDAQQLPKTGVVVAAGPGSRSLDGTLISNAVVEGDVVFFSEYAGQDITVQGAEYLLFREQDILGVLT